MDEASTGLDPGARRELWQYVQELRDREGVTILLTTHILDEADRCDRLVLLHQGRMVAEGSPAESAVPDRRGRGGARSRRCRPRSGRGIEERFGVRPSVVDGALRVEIGNGHRFITEVVEAFPGADRIRWRCTSRRSKTCSSTKQEH